MKTEKHFAYIQLLWKCNKFSHWILWSRNSFYVLLLVMMFYKQFILPFDSKYFFIKPLQKDNEMPISLRIKRFINTQKEKPQYSYKYRWHMAGLYICGILKMFLLIWIFPSFLSYPYFNVHQNTISKKRGFYRHKTCKSNYLPPPWAKQMKLLTE